MAQQKNLESADRELEKTDAHSSREQSSLTILRDTMFLYGANYIPEYFAYKCGYCVSWDLQCEIVIKEKW